MEIRKRYTRKCQNDAAINPIILKTLTQGEWLKGSRQSKEIRRFLDQIQLGVRPGLEIQPRYKAPRDLQVRNWISSVIRIGPNRAVEQSNSRSSMTEFLWVFVFFLLFVSAIILYFTKKALKNYKNCFLFHLKSSVASSSFQNYDIFRRKLKMK